MIKPAALAFLCVAVLPAAGQTKPLVEKGRLSTNIKFEGFRESALPTQCDEQGRSYIKMIKPGREMVGPLLRLSDKGVLEAEFDTVGALINIFAVRPNGGVAMVRIDGLTKVLMNFAPDGKREAEVRLQRTPISFFPYQIAIFRSGELLAAGPRYHPGYKASTAVFSPTGELIRQFDLDGDAEIEHAIELGDARYTREPRGTNRTIPQSVAVTGDDGLVYLMRATSPATVYAISPSGEVVRKVVVQAPTDRSLPAMAVRVIKKNLLVEFHHNCDELSNTSSCQGTDYVVVDATTGDRLADYEQKAVVDSLGCYLPATERFSTFWFPPNEHRLEIVEYGPK